MIDITRPLELADGTAVTFLRVAPSGGIRVRLNRSAGSYLTGASTTFLKSGSHVSNRLPKLRNVADAIDPALPVEYVDGRRPGRVEPASACRSSPPARCILVVDGNYYGIDGKHLYNNFPSIRNVAAAAAIEPALVLTNPITTRDGKKVRFVTKVGGRLVIEVTYPFSAGPTLEYRLENGRVSAGASVRSPDDLINPVVETKEFRNFYSDGSMSDKAHGSHDDALRYSRYNMTRVAIVTITRRNGEFFSAVMSSTPPQTRRP